MHRIKIYNVNKSLIRGSNVSQSVPVPVIGASTPEPDRVFYYEKSIYNIKEIV